MQVCLEIYVTGEKDFDVFTHYREEVGSDVGSFFEEDYGEIVISSNHRIVIIARCEACAEESFIRGSYSTAKGNSLKSGEYVEGSAVSSEVEVAFEGYGFKCAKIIERAGTEGRSCREGEALKRGGTAEGAA